MILVLQLAPVALLWAVVIGRLGTLRQGHVQRALWSTLLACAIATLLDLPLVAPAIDRITGAGPNLAQLAKYVAALVAAAAAREVVRGFALPPELAARGAHRRLGLLVTALTALVGLFALAPVHRQEAASLTERYATNQVMLVFWVVFLGFLGAALVSIAKMTSWYLRNMPGGTLRPALLAIRLGTAAGLGYTTHKACYLLIRVAGGTGGWFVRAEEPVSSGLLGLSMACFVVGISWPRIANQRTVRQVLARRAYRRLYPLWRDLQQATPSIALSSPPAGGRDAAVRLRDADGRLYDRVIEIRDGVLAVRSYLTAECGRLAQAAASAEGVPRRRFQAVVDATSLELARRTKLRGESPMTAGVGHPEGGADVAAEVGLLEQTARAWDAAARLADRVEGSAAVRPVRT